jgi:hypothetical protein
LSFKNYKKQPANCCRDAELRERFYARGAQKTGLSRKLTSAGRRVFEDGRRDRRVEKLMLPR